MAVVVLFGGMVVVLFWFFGELVFVQVFVVIVIIVVLLVIYYLMVSILFNLVSLILEEVVVEDDLVFVLVQVESSLMVYVLLFSLFVFVLFIVNSGKVEDVNLVVCEFLGFGNEVGYLFLVLCQFQVLEVVSQVLCGEVVDLVEYLNMVLVESYVCVFIVFFGGVGGVGVECCVMLVLIDEILIKCVDCMWVDFFVNVSYELCMLFVLLVGFIEILMGYVKDDFEVCDCFLVIMFDQIECMQCLINDFLLFFCVEMDEYVLLVIIIDLYVIVEDVVSFLCLQINKKGIGVKQELNGEVLVIGDCDQIIEVVQNLVENVIKYVGVDVCICVFVLGFVGCDEVECLVLILGDMVSWLILVVLVQEVDVEYVIICVQDIGKGIE